MATGDIYTLVLYLVIHCGKSKPLLNRIHKTSHFRVGQTLPIKMDFLSTRKYLR